MWCAALVEWAIRTTNDHAPAVMSQRFEKRRLPPTDGQRKRNDDRLMLGQFLLLDAIQVVERCGNSRAQQKIEQLFLHHRRVTWIGDAMGVERRLAVLGLGI